METAQNPRKWSVGLVVQVYNGRSEIKEVREGVKE